MQVDMRRRGFILILVFSAVGIVVCRGQDAAEADRLAGLLKWRAGSVVAEVGAGDGKLSLAAAVRVEPGGKVYTTELDPKKLAHLAHLAAQEKNVAALKAGDSETNLPRACCDSIFMRLVYHHLTHPAAIDASLYRSLKPGGLLAVIDREPPPGSSPPKGVPENRGGHGMPQKLLVHELEAAGFQVVTVQDGWPDGKYCVVAARPSP